MLISKNKATQNFILLIKILLSVASCWYILRKIQQDQSSYKAAFSSIENFEFWTIIGIASALLSLTILNWFFEILKWKTLVSEIKHIRFKTASFQTLVGHAIGVFTPNRLGDFGAKVLFFEVKKHKRILGLNFLNNWSQMLATICFGLLGFWFINTSAFDIIQAYNLNLILLFGLAFFALFFILKLFFKEFMKSVKLNLALMTSKKLSVFGYSVLRYLIFSHQYFLFGWLFGWDVNYFMAMPYIFITYFIASFLPSIFILDSALKAGIGIYFFNSIGVSSFVILAISSLMWLLNFALPAIVGNVIMFQLKVRPASIQTQIRTS